MNARNFWAGLGLAAAACLAVAFVWPSIMTTSNTPVAIDQKNGETAAMSDLMASEPMPVDAKPKGGLVAGMDRDDTLAAGEKYRFDDKGLADHLAVTDGIVALKEGIVAPTVSTPLASTATPAMPKLRSNDASDFALYSRGRAEVEAQVAPPQRRAPGKKSPPSGAIELRAGGASPGMTAGSPAAPAEESSPRGSQTRRAWCRRLRIRRWRRRRHGDARPRVDRGPRSNGGASDRSPTRSLTCPTKSRSSAKSELLGDLPFLGAAFVAEKEEDTRDWNREAYTHLVDNPFLQPGT